MPRRPLFTNRQTGWWEQVKNLFLEMRTWTALAYMVLQLPWGIIYFTIFITLLALSLGFILNPILVLFMDVPLIHIGGKAYYSSPELSPLFVFAGLILFLATMHLAKFVGRQHGAIAKALLELEVLDGHQIDRILKGERLRRPARRSSRSRAKASKKAEQPKSGRTPERVRAREEAPVE